MELEIATVETDLFEHRVIRPHFINDCCFGEDFPAWLRQRLADLADFEFSAPIQEDYGWGLWATHGMEQVLDCVVLCWRRSDGDTSAVGYFDYKAHGLNVFKRLFSKPNLTTMEALRARIRRELESKEGIRIL